MAYIGPFIRHSIIANSMFPPQRFTFVSDPTDEFPNSKNNSFNVRLPTWLVLPDNNWYVSLWSMSVPDDALTNNTVLSDPEAQVIDFAFHVYRLYNFNGISNKYTSLTKYFHKKILRIEDVMDADYPITSGVEFWKNVETRVQQTVENKLYTLEAAHPSNTRVVVPIKWTPTFTWDNDDLVMPNVARDVVATASFSWFGIKVAIAVSFGFIKWDASTNTYVLGPNAIPIYQTYTERGDNILTSLPNVYNVDGKSRA